MIRGVAEIERNASLAIPDIANHLNRGALKIFLGAGVSKGFCLPGWNELIHSVVVEYQRSLGEELTLTLNDIKTMGKVERLTLLDPIEKRDDYLSIVHSSLYSKVNELDLRGKFINSSAVLLAIAAFCIGSTRGTVNQIFTLNYDDLLEQYLTLLGLRVDSKSDSNYYDIRSRADVRVDHIHGFLPQSLPPNSHQKIIFSNNSYKGRTRELTESISAWITSQMIGYIGLYVGLSGDDELLEHLLHFQHKQKIEYCSPADQYYGYFILTPDAYANHSDQLETEYNICPIKLEKDKIPNFLLGCCQKASDLAQNNS